jgi:hypothetical protein
VTGAGNGLVPLAGVSLQDGIPYYVRRGYATLLVVSRARGPRRHYHLSSESIARAALTIVDREGVEALNLRDLAASLGVGTMTLYRYVSGRDEIVKGIVGLLLAEIDTAVVPGETWDETIRRVKWSPVMWCNS